MTYYDMQCSLFKSLKHHHKLQTKGGIKRINDQEFISKLISEVFNLVGEQHKNKVCYNTSCQWSWIRFYKWRPGFNWSTSPINLSTAKSLSNVGVQLKVVMIKFLKETCFPFFRATRYCMLLFLVSEWLVLMFLWTIDELPFFFGFLGIRFKVKIRKGI